MSRFFRYIIVVFCLLGIFSPVYSRTTGNGIARNINLDGKITLGATIGSNTSDWEPDELLKGKNETINWYISWDDDFLYIGRKGGSNTDASVIFVHAGFEQAQFADVPGIAVDGFKPGFSVMGGINFIANINNASSEFHRYQSGWSVVPGTDSTAFSVQNEEEQMETRIAWDNVTSGNGKPEHIKLVVYQVTESADECNGAMYSYAESPWGTGQQNDGPSVGVNDGISTSEIQPNGCGTENAEIKRWWGSFEVQAGVSFDGWLPETTSTGFSPNGDRVNDVWKLSGLDQYNGAEFEIYTAWGNRIYSGSVEEGSVGWDGTWNGNPAPEANYFYLINFQDATTLKGTITLIR